LIISSVVRSERKGPAAAALTDACGTVFPSTEVSVRNFNPEEARRPDAVGVEEPRRVGHVDVEGRSGRRDDGPGERRPAHVLDVDQRVGGLAEREHQGPALLELDVGGPLQQVAGDSVGDRAERAGAAGDDDHSAYRMGAGGDRRREVRVGVDRQPARGGSRNGQTRDPVRRRGDAGVDLVAGDFERGVRDDEMNAREAARDGDALDEALREMRTRAARNTDDELCRHGPAV
jgi:hypothetical protein